MACYTPIAVKVYKSEPLKDLKRLVPCGQCEDCLNSKRAAWTVRLESEERECNNAYFITLTYKDETIPFEIDGTIKRGIQSIPAEWFWNNQIHPQGILLKSDLQKFFKRYRKKNPDTDLKYYAVGEYGDKSHRPHFHAIVFNVDIWKLLNSWNDQNGQIGRIHTGTVTTQSMNYVTSYVINKQKYAKRTKYPPFALMSKGLGRNYINESTIKYHIDRFDSTILKQNGTAYAMPRYYKSKIFSDEQITRIGEQNRKRAEDAVEDYETEISKRNAKRHRIANSKKGKQLNI